MAWLLFAQSPAPPDLGQGLSWAERYGLALVIAVPFALCIGWILLVIAWRFPKWLDEGWEWVKQLASSHKQFLETATKQADHTAVSHTAILETLKALSSDKSRDHGKTHAFLEGLTHIIEQAVEGQPCAAAVAAKCAELRRIVG